MEIVGIDLTLLEGNPGIRPDIPVSGQIPAQRSADAQPWTPALHRIIFGVDMEGSTQQLNSAKGHLRRVMYDLTETAFRHADITKHRDRNVDRGDGLLTLIRADEVPKALLLDTVVPTLATLAAEHNRLDPVRAVRLRVVVDAGEVHFDHRGQFGQSLDLACRLLDAGQVKRRLAQTTAPLVLVISDSLHRSTVTQGYDGIDVETFSPFSLRVGGRLHRGWIQASGDPGTTPIAK